MPELFLKLTLLIALTATFIPKEVSAQAALILRAPRHLFLQDAFLEVSRHLLHLPQVIIFVVF